MGSPGQRVKNPTASAVGFGQARVTGLEPATFGSTVRTTAGANRQQSERVSDSPDNLLTALLTVAAELTAEQRAALREALGGE